MFIYIIIIMLTLILVTIMEKKNSLHLLLPRFSQTDDDNININILFHNRQSLFFHSNIYLHTFSLTIHSFISSSSSNVF